MPRYVCQLAWFALIPISTVAAQRDTTRAAKDSAARAAQALTPVLVSASREPMQLSRLGFSASVITNADLRLEPALSMADAAGRIPGVYMDANAGPGGPTNIRLRGADESYTKVLMDGVEVNVSGGPFRFQGITAGNLDRIELVRGPQSALHGSSAMAGVVQYLTAAGKPGVTNWSLETEGGAAAVNGGHGGASATLSGGTDQFRYSLGAGASYGDGIYAVKNDLKTREASVRLDYDPSSTFTLTGTLRYNHMDSHLPVRNPGATRVPLDPNQRDQNEMAVAGLTATLTPSRDWTHQLRLAAYHDLFSYTDQLDAVPPHPSIGYFNGNAYTSTDLLRTTLSYDATRRFGGADGRAASWTFGAQLERETTGDTVGGDFGNGFTPQRRDNAGIFSEVNARVGSSTYLLGGARLERYQGLGWIAVPRASIRVDAVPDRLSFRASIGRGFKAANIEQQFSANAFIVPNPNLKPETSWSGEVGATVTLTDEVQVSATYFQQSFFDQIRVVAAPAPETRFISENLGRSDATGVELEATWKLPNGVTAEASASWINTKIVDNAGLSPSQFPIGASVPSAPSFLGGGTLNVPFGRWHAVARATAVGNDVVLSEIFSGTRQTLDPYAIFGLTLSYDVSHGVTLFTRGDNLLNTYYPAGYDRRGNSRTWTAGFRLTN